MRSQGGLRLAFVHSMGSRPINEPPVQQLIPPWQRHYLYYRSFFAISFNRNGETRRPVLLGANSLIELDRLAAESLTEADAVCSGANAGCIAFPQGCSVSVEMEITVNGVRRSIAWGSLLAAVTSRTRHVELLRLDQGQLTPVKLGPLDSKT